MQRISLHDGYGVGRVLMPPFNVPTAGVFHIVSTGTIVASKDTLTRILLVSSNQSLILDKSNIVKGTGQFNINTTEFLLAGTSLSLYLEKLSDNPAIIDVQGSNTHITRY